MSLITFPTDPNIGFETISLTLERKSFTMKSPFTGKRQVAGLAYALWMFEGKFVPVDQTSNPTATRLLRSFLAKLQGQVNTFQMPVPGYSGPASAYAGAAGLVNGANQVGTTIITDGWSNSTAIFKEGDYFTVNNELKIVTADATSNGSGQVTINFEPAIRVSPADNAAFNYATPYAVFAADKDDAAKWALSSPVIHNISLIGVEAY